MLGIALCQAQMSPAVTKPQKTTIAVLDLNGPSMSKEEITLLSDRLRLQLFQTRAYKVLERAQMDAILKEQGFQQSGSCDDQACVVEAGQLLGVQQIVAGSIGKLGNTFMLNIRLIDVRTAALVRTVSRDCPCPIEGIIPILKEIAVSLAPQAEKPAPKQVTKPPRPSPPPIAKPAKPKAPLPTKLASQVRGKKGKFVRQMSVGYAMGLKRNNQTNPLLDVRQVQVNHFTSATDSDMLLFGDSAAGTAAIANKPGNTIDLQLFPNPQLGLRAGIHWAQVRGSGTTVFTSVTGFSGSVATKYRNDFMLLRLGLQHTIAEAALAPYWGGDVLLGRARFDWEFGRNDIAVKSSKVGFGILAGSILRLGNVLGVGLETGLDFLAFETFEGTQQYSSFKANDVTLMLGNGNRLLDIVPGPAGSGADGRSDSEASTIWGMGGLRINLMFQINFGSTRESSN